MRKGAARFCGSKKFQRMKPANQYQRKTTGDDCKHNDRGILFLRPRAEVPPYDSQCGQDDSRVQHSWAQQSEHSMRHLLLEPGVWKKKVLKVRDCRDDDSQRDQGGKAPRQPVRSPGLLCGFRPCPYFCHQDAERNHGGKKVTRKLGLRNGEKDKNQTRPAEKKQHGSLWVPRKFPPLADPVNARVEQEEAPRKEAGQIDDEVVVDGAGAVRMPRSKPLQAFLPEGVSRKIRVPHGDRDKPGQRYRKKRRQPQEPIQILQARKVPAQGLVDCNGKQRQQESHRPLRQSGQAHRCEKQGVE